MTAPDDPRDSEHEEEPAQICTILLAAGESSRMGKPKQLLPVGGIPLLRHMANVARVSTPGSVVVVLGANEPAHRKALDDTPVEIVTNHFWKNGMGSSIKTGLQYVIKSHPDATAILIMVCDQPKLTADHLRHLVETYAISQKKITASGYDQTVGVPAVFGRAFFSNLLMLKDDQGAKKIIEQFADQVTTVSFPEGSIDLDTPDDYDRFIRDANPA